MKINIKKILGGILLSSLAAIPNASGNTSQQENVSTLASSFLTGSEDKKKDQSKYTFVLPTNNRQLMLAAHSSHKSHSSHSSHSSHRSSSGGSSYSSGGSSTGSRLPSVTKPDTTTPSGGSRLPSITKPSQSSPSSTTTKPASSTSTKQTTPVAPKTYQFWERELREGMSGNDVTQLATLLISYKYLEKQKNGYKVYTADVRKAVFAFQKDAQIPATGVCDKETATRLKNWKETVEKKKDTKEKSNSDYQEIPSIVSKEKKPQEEKKEIKLGDRNLSIGSKGTDVDELILLLKKNEFLLKDSESTFFDLAVRDAVKKFQNKVKLDETGTADKKTIKALHEYKVK